MYNIDTLLNNDLEILRTELNSIDMTKMQRCIENGHPWYKGLFLEQPGREHYRFLAWLGYAFEGKTIWDIGTLAGMSALSLGHCENTKVITWDIKELTSIDNHLPNVTYRIGDFRQDLDVLNSPCILIDVDPHDGIQEEEFHRFFLESGYQGLVFWDDIHTESLKPWWNSVQGVDKMDFTSIGHWSGTGLIIYR